MFIKTVSELAYGEAVTDFDAAIVDLIAAVQEHQKPGSFTLMLKFIPQGIGSTQVVIEDGYKVVTPEKDRMKTVMFVQRDGTLGRRDPRQPELPFREVPKGVDAETGEIDEEAMNG